MSKKKTNKQWKKKCDKLISNFYRGKPCLVCGTKVRTCGHHLITRQRAKSRHALINVVPLCPEHHKFSNFCAAHSSNYFAVREFADFIKSNYPNRYLYWSENQTVVQPKTDYEEKFHQLKKEIDNFMEPY
jgi:hypothetical protein